MSKSSVITIIITVITVISSCTLIAIGNGTACRETESWISDLYDDGILNPKRVRYCIVNEQGASIYSVSDIARKEFPKLDVNLISAGENYDRLRLNAKLLREYF